MIFRIVLLGIFTICSTVHCRDSGSAEANKIEATPIYDTIIFSDVADIFNDLENGLNPLEALFNSASDSEENLEDLLLEYQHYLDKAHNQHLNYLEKTKTKNKVPPARHDRFAKTKPAGGMKNDDYYYSGGNYINPSKFTPSQYGNPLDIFMPMNQNLRFFGKVDQISNLPKEEYQSFNKRMLDLPPILPKSRFDPIKSPCFCKNAQLPCDCKCKQCLIYDAVSNKYYPHPNDKGFYPPAELPEDKLNDDNTLNIKIKVDIQLPKIKDLFTKLLKNPSHEELLHSKESTVSVPFPLFNFPIPMDLLGFKKPLKTTNRDYPHKITIHKKKKSRTNSGSKKHRKKIITVHNLNIEPQTAKLQPYFDEALNTSIDFSEKVTESSSKIDLNSTFVPTTVQPANLDNSTNIAAITTAKDKATPVSETQTEESFFVMVNISNTSDNGTEDAHKIENSVETDYTKTDVKVPTETLLKERKKREASPPSPTTSQAPPKEKSTEATYKPVEFVKPVSQITSQQKNYNEEKKTVLIKTNNDNKKSDKAVLGDSELVYWPMNKNLTDYTSKNITTIILEREDKKAKMNMTKEAIKNNRTTALEKAIFGDVNWDDVDTVAPVFLSFVGKYIRGVLTFCSQNVCHSMKCSEKTCVHRICHPTDRWNQRGHCAGSNKTDSVASLESIMDLPSNVAFEIVDILQDKMLGKLFGKVTLCINTKCITFVAVKKTFLKSKCSVKDLKMGHCPNMKNFKLM